MIIKRSLIVFVTTFAVIFTQFTVSGSDTILVYYNDRLLLLDSDPVIHQNRTLVPMQSIFGKITAVKRSRTDASDIYDL